MNTHLAKILSGRTKDVQPFSFFAVTDALPEAEFARLVDEFPANDVVTRGKPLGDNRRFSLPAGEVLASPHVSNTWKRFVEAHVSQDFLQQTLQVLAPDIQAVYPELERKIGRPMSEWRAGMRHRHTFREADVLLDAQLCINSPVLSAASSVRGPHVDKPNKLFAGLFYLRPETDTETQGGDLLIYRYRKPAAKFDGAELEPHDVEVAETVPYRGNTFVLFLNSLQALHGVTPRQITARTRYFLNLIAEVEHPLFDLKSRQRRFRGVRHAWTKLTNRLNGRETVSGQRWD